MIVRDLSTVNKFVLVRLAARRARGLHRPVATRDRVADALQRSVAEVTEYLEGRGDLNFRGREVARAT